MTEADPSTAVRSTAAALTNDWQVLCERYLPVVTDDSIWRYSREGLPGDPEQGWKLHVSATILNAGETLKIIGPFLSRRGLLFKAPSSLAELGKLNTGIFYGYSQVGKVVTVYPQTSEEAVLLASKLYRLTRGSRAPSIPFDFRYRGCIYYRYGAFNSLNFEGSNGRPIPSIRDPDGRLVEDVRDSISQPSWVSDPFVQPSSSFTPPPSPTPLKTTFRAFRALGQRGKGGVYQAIDLSATPARLCVLKEGRKNGEVDWDGRDGFWRIKHERRVLGILRQRGIDVPCVYSSFVAAKNYYVAIEYIDGENLRQWLERKQRRMSIRAVLKYGAELARMVSRIHAAGWVWRDCKPANVVITTNGMLRPVDFEGACPVDHPDSAPWGTAAYVPPEVNSSFKGESRVPEDLYAVGAVIYHLLTGRTADVEPPSRLTKLRRGIPAPLRDVVMDLLDPDPQQRPSAHDAAARLEALR